MTKKRDEAPKWPVLQEPVEMLPEELESILFALGTAYGFEYEMMPSRVVAPALGVSPRTVDRWKRGDGPVDASAAKLLRLFHAQSRIF